jgi:cytochrome c
MPLPEKDLEIPIGGSFLKRVFKTKMKIINFYVQLLGLLFIGPEMVFADSLSVAKVSAEVMRQGNRIYQRKCSVCHLEKGQGLLGVYPALAGKSKVPEVNELIKLLRTKSNPGQKALALKEHENLPPLNTSELAVLITYIRNSWGYQGGLTRESNIREMLRSKNEEK